MMANNDLGTQAGLDDAAEAQDGGKADNSTGSAGVGRGLQDALLAELSKEDASLVSTFGRENIRSAALSQLFDDDSYSAAFLGREHSPKVWKAIRREIAAEIRQNQVKSRKGNTKTADERASEDQRISKMSDSEYRRFLYDNDRATFRMLGL